MFSRSTASSSSSNSTSYSRLGEEDQTSQNSGAGDAPPTQSTAIELPNSSSNGCKGNSDFVVNILTARGEKYRLTDIGPQVLVGDIKARLDAADVSAGGVGVGGMRLPGSGGGGGGGSRSRLKVGGCC